MITFASLLLAQAASAVPAAPADIYVTPIQIEALEAQLSAVEASVGQLRTGGWRCALTGSTGSPYVDQRLCQSTARCTSRHAYDPGRLANCMRSERREIIEDYRDYLRG